MKKAGSRQENNSLESQYQGSGARSPDLVEDVPASFAKKIMGAPEVTLIGGPFHYHLRTPTYGDPFDEVPWKVKMGLELPRERHGYSANPFVCQYDSRVMINNWVEEQRDRNYLKYRSPKISQYGHHYVSETMRSFTKLNCNKQRDLLLNIASFPLAGHPGLQSELYLDTLRCSAPEPENCVVEEKLEKCKKEMVRDRRYYEASL